MLHVLNEKTTILDKAKHNKCYGRGKRLWGIREKGYQLLDHTKKRASELSPETQAGF